MFINNDGDLFTYGEAICGLLPHVNERLHAAGSPKQYNNLFGVTLGTGFGAGIVHNGELFIGDNAAAAEIWECAANSQPLPRRRGREHPRRPAGLCGELEGEARRAPTPKDIYEFACGSGQGDRQAAILRLQHARRSIGDALANAITLVDGLVVIGGGLSAAAPLFMPRLVAEMNGTIESSPAADSAHGTEGVQPRRRSPFDAFARGEARQSRARQRPACYLRPAEAYRRRALPPGHQPRRLHRRLRVCVARIGCQR